MGRSVIIYTQISCKPCQEQKAWLKHHQISYEERDVRLKEEYFNEAVSFGASSTPVTIVESEGSRQVILGFDKERLKQALQLNG